MQKYLEVSEYIDWDNKQILSTAKDLSAGLTDKNQIAKKCFQWVRDEIKHTADYQMDIITLKASEVLKFKTGYCYAKSHLLAALLRANNIPAGLCYQRLSLSDEYGPFCLHGLNAIYLDQYGWYKVDSRGNKNGINAQFCPPVEQLAFSLKHNYDISLPGIRSTPLPQVIKTFTLYSDYESINKDLPDL